MAAAEPMLTRGDFIARFEAGLDGLDWPEARRRYDALCHAFAPAGCPGGPFPQGCDADRL